MARRVTDIDELLARATERGPYVASDAKTGSSLERLVVDGERYVVKWVHVDDDWAMPGDGDLRARPRLVQDHRLLDVVPDRIDHTVVAAAPWGRNDWGAVLVMREEAVPRLATVERAAAAAEARVSRASRSSRGASRSRT